VNINHELVPEVRTQTRIFGIHTNHYHYGLCGSWLKKIRNRLYYPLILLIFISCTSISPVYAEPASFSSIESLEPQWHVLANGINYFHGRIMSPVLEFWALQINLRAPNVRIVASPGAVSNGRILSARVSSFVRDNNLVAGINALPFDIASSREGQPIRNMGIVVSGGELIAPVNPRYDALVIYRNGTAAIVNQSSIRSIENIENAVGGFFQVLINGTQAARTLANEARHPRSAAGVSANGVYLYLLVIDGRRSSSIGSTEEETAMLLRALGSWNGINFDGGGSTALAMRFPDNRIRVLNIPVHGGIPGQERAVAGSIGVTIAD
jgi:hypothetical protein